MNLFLIAWNGGPADRFVSELAAELPFFEGRQVEAWSGTRAAAAWIAHDPRHSLAEGDRLALWAGRPFAWRDEHETDGRGPLDAAFYLRPAAGWVSSLDGRAAAVRVTADELEVYSDPLGSYPLYVAERDGTTWISNNARLAAAASGAEGTDMSALAGLLGGGWPLSGHPLHAGVRRLAPGLNRFAPSGARRHDPLVTAEEIARMPGAGLDPAEAARVLVGAVRALADWPGRPSVVPVTGGRDARLVLAAALRAGFRFETQTGGAEHSPDVRVGRLLAERAGVPHSIAHEPGGYALSRWRHASRLVELMGSGTASLADSAGFPMGPREGTPILWHTGQGGEIARRYYGAGESLFERFTGERVGRPHLLNREAAEDVRGQIEEWAAGQLAAGVARDDLGDMFYVHRRMGTWAGPTHGAQEFIRDATSALWSRRVLPHMLGPPAAERALEAFHLRLIEELAPELAEIPFGDGTGWGARQGPLALRVERARKLARRARGAVARRARARLPRRAAQPAPDAPQDHFALAFPEIAETVLSQPSHEAWAVLERPRVERLLRADPGSLDEMSRYYVWRLAQVFTRG